MADNEKLKAELTDLLLGDDPQAGKAWAEDVLQGEIGVAEFFNFVLHCIRS